MTKTEAGYQSLGEATMEYQESALEDIDKADKVKSIVEDAANKLISKHELTPDDISTNANADIISINKLEIECIIGVLPEERNKAQPIFISIDIFTKFSDAVDKDDLNKTIDYNQVAIRAKEIAISGKFHLIETLSEHIAKMILSHPKTFKTKITLYKPKAILNAHNASVTIERTK